MDLPQRVYVLARLPADGPGEGAMRLYTLAGPDQRPLTPVFSSIVRAAQFLEGAQAAGVKIAFDYVFPTSAAQLAADFSAYQTVLDPDSGDLFASLQHPHPDHEKDASGGPHTEQAL
jgi:hypothetical protein